ncbi:hypothetical protein N7512_003229 [Penicillium capsulatum]|nr:hypothetical protein N7512_003229 [Penicillium capsulatum]
MNNRFLMIDSDDLLNNSLRTNVHGPLNMTRAFLPLMRARGSGTVLFSGTLGVYHGAPGASPYTASKALLDALVPNLAIEIASFGLRVSMLVYGHFRTNVMAPGRIQHRASHALPEYAELNRLVREGCAAVNGNQPGDPKKACGLIVEAVRGEGRCAGKQLPLRLPIGSDAFQRLRENAAEKTRMCDEWEGITLETNVETA